MKVGFSDFFKTKKSYNIILNVVWQLVCDKSDTIAVNIYDIDDSSYKIERKQGINADERFMLPNSVSGEQKNYGLGMTMYYMLCGADAFNMLNLSTSVINRAPFLSDSMITNANFENVFLTQLESKLAEDIILLTSFDEGKRNNAFNELYSKLCSLPCTYIFDCIADKGNVGRTETFSFGYTTNMYSMWADGSSDTKTIELSDSKNYTFKAIKFEFVPGTHRLKQPIKAQRELIAKSICLGLDLGTKYAYLSDGEGNLISIDSEHNYIESLVAYRSETEYEIGIEAYDISKNDKRCCVDSLKLLLGDENIIAKSITSLDGTKLIKSGSDVCVDFMCDLFNKLKKMLITVEKIIVAVPSFLSTIRYEQAFQAVKKAARISGIDENNVFIEYEGVLTCYSYGLIKSTKPVGVFDMGSEISEFSIVKGGKIIASDSTIRICAETITNAIINIIKNQASDKGIYMPNEADIHIKDVALFYSELKENAEKAKKSLISNGKASIIISGTECVITKQALYESVSKQLQNIDELVKGVLRRASLKEKDLEAICISASEADVGFISESVKKLFPSSIAYESNADRAKAIGCSRLFEKMADKLIVSGKINHDIGIAIKDRYFAPMYYSGENISENDSRTISVGLENISSYDVPIYIYKRRKGNMQTKIPLMNSENGVFENIGALKLKRKDGKCKSAQITFECHNNIVCARAELTDLSSVDKIEFTEL